MSVSYSEMALEFRVIKYFSETLFCFGVVQICRRKGVIYSVYYIHATQTVPTAQKGKWTRWYDVIIKKNS